MQIDRLRFWGLLWLALAVGVSGCDEGSGARVDRTDAVAARPDGGNATDAAGLDAARADAAREAGREDATLADAHAADTMPADGAILDATAPDTALADLGTVDTGLADRGSADAEVANPCQGRPDDTVLAVLVSEPCAFADACALQGHQRQVIQVCRAGRPVQVQDDLICERNTHGAVVSASGFGRCAFDTDCSEIGTRSRTLQVCRNGVATPELAIEPCARATDGLRVQEGTFDACAFADRCAEVGTQARPNGVCRSGVVALEVETQPCSRETDGVQVPQSTFGACIFEDPCVAFGTLTRIDQICRNGAATPEPQQQPCGPRQTEGDLAALGAPVDCEYADACVETGSRVPMDFYCRSGVPTLEPREAPCSRITEGIVADQEPYGDCVFADVCVETGTQSRPRRVCRGGQAIPELQRSACERETDENTVSVGAFGPCTFTDACAEIGSHSRFDQVCRDGIRVNTVTTETCGRSTEGTVLSEGTFGDCSYADPCVETGVATRTRLFCHGGLATPESHTQTCTRETDGVVASRGSGAQCATSEPCGQEGTATRTDLVCRDGVATPEPFTFRCVQNTEGMVIARRVEGPCRFANDCVEGGLWTVIKEVCHGGEPVAESVPGDCYRQTEDTLLAAGDFGPCAYAHACDVEGARARPVELCRAGANRVEWQRQGCVREAVAPACETVGPCPDGDCGCPDARPNVCKDICVRVEDDARFCGACDVACGDDESCHEGACVPRCGDGVLDAGEQCDDGNASDVDGCLHCRLTDPGACAEPCDVEHTAVQLSPQPTTQWMLPEPDYRFPNYGSKVVIDGDWAVASGSAVGLRPLLVFERQVNGEWALQQMLRGDAVESTGSFANALALSDDTLVVGASQDGLRFPNAGSVYVFTRGANDVWSQQQHIVAANAAPDERLGESVALQGDRLVLGLPGANDAHPLAGAVLIYGRDPLGQWQLAARLVAPDPAPNDQFGASVALDGDTLAVKAGTSNQMPERNAVYVFTRAPDGQWLQQARFTKPGLQSTVDFGSVMDLKGDSLLVSSASDNTGTGAVFHWQRDAEGTWALTESIRVPGLPTQSRFGSAIAREGAYALIAAPTHRNQGSVFVYEQVGGQWLLRHRLAAPRAVDTYFFGSAVALRHGRAVVGAIGEAGQGTNSGSVHFYDLFRPTCTDDGKCVALEVDASAP